MHHPTDRIAHTTALHVALPQGGALVGTRNRLMGPPGGIDPTTYCTMSGRSTTKLRPALTI